jgi:hypothetical protein
MPSAFYLIRIVNVSIMNSFGAISIVDEGLERFEQEKHHEKTKLAIR